MFENSSSESVKQSTEFLAERAKDSESNGNESGTVGADDRQILGILVVMSAAKTLSKRMFELAANQANQDTHVRNLAETRIAFAGMEASVPCERLDKLKSTIVTCVVAPVVRATQRMGIRFVSVFKTTFAYKVPQTLTAI
jgi:hypothetical protein